MSIGIIVPKGFWPRPGERFECELTDVELTSNGVRRRFETMPSGVRITMTLERYITQYDGLLIWITERGWFYAKGAMSRFGWDAANRRTYPLPLPYWVLISCFDRWPPDVAASAVGLPDGTLPDLPYQDRYPRWCAIYLEKKSDDQAT